MVLISVYGQHVWKLKYSYPYIYMKRNLDIQLNKTFFIMYNKLVERGWMYWSFGQFYHSSSVWLDALLFQAGIETRLIW